MMPQTEERVGGELPTLYGLEFIPGCNTPLETRDAQASVNLARDIPWLMPEAVKPRPLIVVGGGPSLKARWEEIKDYDGDILALNNAYPFLIERGIVPKYFMLLDARRENIETIRTPHPDVVHFLAAQCHPDIFDQLLNLGLDTRLYVTSMESLQELVEGIDRPKLIIGGPIGTVGMKALSVGYALGYREFHLFGYDSSQDNGQHHAYPQSWNDGARMLDVYIGDMRFTTSPSMAMQVAGFPAAVKSLQDEGCSFELHCDGLLPYFVGICNTLGEVPLELRERDKYAQMWKVDAYRKEAPGESYVTQAIEQLGIRPGDRVVDFGCGTGRGAKAFQDYGCIVLGVDHVREALETDIPFIECCLWEIPAMRANWGYCTDVMEHIPTEKVGEVLWRIADSVKGCFFSIATEPDNLGKRIGRVLHVTCLPALWWEAEMTKVFNDVEMVEGDGVVIFVARNTPAPEQEK